MKAKRKQKPTESDKQATKALEVARASRDDFQSYQSADHGKEPIRMILGGQPRLVAEVIKETDDEITVREFCIDGKTIMPLPLTYRRYKDRLACPHPKCNASFQVSSEVCGITSCICKATMIDVTWDAGKVSARMHG